jgi:hypothetical protein
VQLAKLSMNFAKIIHEDDKLDRQLANILTDFADEIN